MNEGSEIYPSDGLRHVREKVGSLDEACSRLLEVLSRLLVLLEG